MKRETSRDDRQRTDSFLYDIADTVTDDVDFTDVVWDGLTPYDTSDPYPPVGHGYPRKG
jgi:hypothetical protein